MAEVTPLEERRQRAREAGQDALPPVSDGEWSIRYSEDAIEAAIETATRVQITDEIEDSVQAARTDVRASAADVARAALRAAGFEVEP